MKTKRTHKTTYSWNQAMIQRLLVADLERHTGIQVKDPMNIKRIRPSHATPRGMQTLDFVFYAYTVDNPIGDDK